jgi:hypothetical protein
MISGQLQTVDALKKEFAGITGPLDTLRHAKDSPYVNFSTAAAEGTAAFTWPWIELAPLNFVELGRDGSEFYNNKVRKEGYVASARPGCCSRTQLLS